jgi:hypothetical protein
MTDMTEVLSRSRLSLDAPVRDALEQGRTVRSRNRDGEYAIVISDDDAFHKTSVKHIDFTDAQADWTIVVPDFTLSNVAQASADGEPELCFWAPVFERAGGRVGTMRVNGSPYGRTLTDQGPVKSQTVFSSTLRAGDLFRESDRDASGAAPLLRATADADDNGRVEAETVAGGGRRVFDLGPDYLVFKVID